MVERVSPDIELHAYRNLPEIHLVDLAYLAGTTKELLTSPSETESLRREGILKKLEHKIEHSYHPNTTIIPGSTHAGFQKRQTTLIKKDNSTVYPIKHSLIVCYETLRDGIISEGLYQFPVTNMQTRERGFLPAHVLGEKGRGISFTGRQIAVIQTLAANPPRPTLVQH